MSARRVNPIDGEPEPRVTMAAFNRALREGSPEEVEAALFAIAAAGLEDDDYEYEGEEPPERVVTAADLNRIEAEAEARAEARGGWDVVYDEAAAAALAPLPDFDLSDSACLDIAALIAPYAALDES